MKMVLQCRKLMGVRRSVALLSRNILSAVPRAPYGEVNPLLDRYDRVHDYLRISLTERCNLRCQYCMPEEGVALSAAESMLSVKELERLVTIFAGLGVRKIRLTGGEPLVRRDLEDIVAVMRSVKGIEMVNMTTNGVTLSRRLAALQAAGLHGVNISLDTLQPAKFQFITRRKGLEKVLKSMETALHLGMPQVKVNCVVMKGLNDDEIVDFVKLTENMRIDVRFIEYMPFSGNKWNSGKFVSYRDMLSSVLQVWPQLTKIKDEKNDTAKSYRVPGYAGRIGFISSMTNNFCSSCNRLRITADGNLKVCLFGNGEVSLRDAIRSGASDNDIVNLITSAVTRKEKRHAGMFNLFKMKNRPMILIGVLLSHQLTSRAKQFPFSLPLLLYRSFSSLSHVSDSGNAVMVDISDKRASSRWATASGKIHLSPRAMMLVMQAETSRKGSVLAVAEVAAILAAKKTADIIPLCHSLPLSHVQLTWDIQKEEGFVIAMATVRTEGRTGVEMEALLAVSVALVTVFDMTKSVSHEHIISEIKVNEKGGGKSGHTYFHKN